MRTDRVLVLSCVVTALLCATPLVAPAQQSVADGFPPDILSPALALPGTTDLTYAGLDTGDVNEDGLPDLLAFDVVKFDGGPYWMALYQGTPGGDLSPPMQLAVPAVGLVELPHPRLVDVNADGHLDVMGVYLHGSVAVYLGHGDGTFDPFVLTTNIVSGGPSDFDVGDVDNDGFPDVVLSDNSFFTAYRILWVRGNGDGTFGAPVKLLGARFPATIIVRDLNADGLSDIAFLDSGENGQVVVVHLGLGGGAFASGVAYPAVPSSFNYSALATADANGDGHLDLYNAPGQMLEQNDGVHILLGTGDGAFVPGPIVNFGNSVPATFAVEDIDRDGVPDLLGSSGFDYRLQRMGHDGAIGPTLTVSAGGQITAMTVADLDDDGLPDFAAIRNKQAVRVLNMLQGFIDVGYGQTGAIGTPILTVSGTPKAGQPIVAGVALDSAVPALLVIGASSDLLPFHGGVLVPEPDVLLPIVTGSTFPGQWPKTILPGTAVHVQAVLAIGGGQTLNSNALVMIAE
jgi:hypothetical protein